MFVLHRDGSYRWHSGGLGAAQETVVTTSSGTERDALRNVNAFLDTPVVAAVGPVSTVPAKEGVDWVFWAKSAGIAGAVVFGFLWLTRIKV